MIQGATTVLCTILISLYLIVHQRKQRKLIGMELSRTDTITNFKKPDRDISRIGWIHEYRGYTRRVIHHRVGVAIDCGNNLE